MKPRRIIARTFIILGACVIAGTAGAVGYPQSSLPRTGLQEAQVRPLTAGMKEAPFKGVDVTRIQCNDAWFRFLPGNPDYCHGIHKWADGNYDAALFDLKDAAGWANKNAQYALGLIYFNGHHVTEDRPLGLAWLMLSAERRKPQHYVDVAVAAYRLATPQERQQAIALLKQMRPRFGDAFAAHRAKLHFKRAITRTVRQPNAPGSIGTLSIAGISPFATSTDFVMSRMHEAEQTYFRTLPEGHVDVGPVKQVDLPIYDH